MDARIILGAQVPDIAGSIARGQANAMRAQQMQQQNRLADVYQQHGAGAIQGDQNALAAMAGVNPQLAGQFRQQNIANERAERQMQMNEQQFAFQVQKQAAAMSAQQRAAEAEQIKQGVFAASNAQTPEQWDQIVTGLGQTDLVGQFGQKDQLLRMYMTAAQILEADAPAKPQSALGKLNADHQAGLIDDGMRDAAVAKATASDSFLVESNADGSTRVSQGINPTDLPDMTVDEGKNTGFFVRMRDSHALLNQFEQEGSSVRGRILENIPFGVGNFMQTEDYQKFEQARRDFVNAVLRRESGAVISEQEFANAERQYFPVPGDSPEVIAQKRRNRENSILGVEVSAGPGALDPRVQDAAPASSEVPQSVRDQLGDTADLIWQNMTNDEKALFQ